MATAHLPGTTLRQEQGFLLSCLVALSLALLADSPLALGLLALGELLLLFWPRDEVRRPSLRALLLLGLFLLLSVLPLAFQRATDQSYGSFLGWGISADGLLLAGRTFLRCCCAILATRLLLVYVPLYRLYSVLRSLGVPKLFIELVELTYRYIFLLEETAAQIRLAQLSRLGYQGPLRKKLEHFGLLLARTFILSQTEADRLYLGLVSRGYDEEAASPVHEAKPTVSATPLLELSGISFAYSPDKPILQGLDLTVSRGERVALLGHNGAGKSTLFLLLAGLQEQWSGTLTLAGTPVSPKERLQLRRHIALVLQNSNYQLFTPSVEEELAFGLKNLGLQGPELQQRLEELLDLYELQPLRHRPPHQLSEGQKKWVALAAILATEPEVILLDEPTAALDQRYTRRVLQLLDRLSLEGKTIILSTHDMELANQFAQRVLLLEQGKLTADRPAEKFWADRALLCQAELDQPYAWRERAAVSSSPVPTPSSAPKYHLPLFLSADLLPVLFIGGGEGIWRKAQGLLERDLPFTILSESLCPALQEAYAAGRFTWLAGRYTGSEDLSAYRIIVCGIGDSETERSWSQRWSLGGFLYALLSDPDAGNIQFGAATYQQGITLAVHSDYRLPDVSVFLRDQWAAWLPSELEGKLEELAALRRSYLRATLPEEKAARKQAYLQAKSLILQQLIR